MLSSNIVLILSFCEEAIKKSSIAEKSTSFSAALSYEYSPYICFTENSFISVPAITPVVSFVYSSSAVKSLAVISETVFKVLSVSVVSLSINSLTSSSVSIRPSAKFTKSENVILMPSGDL